MRKSVKRIVALVATGVMCFTMGMGVLAAGSINITGKVTAKDASGNEVKAEMKEIPAEYAEIVKEVSSVEKLKELLGDSYTEGMAVVASRDVTVPEGTEFPLTLTFEVTGVKAGSKVAMLHYDTEKKAWEKIAATAGDNSITGTFNSLSPVVFVSDSATSPKTGEVAPIAAVGCAAILAAAGMYLSMKKRKAC